MLAFLSNEQTYQVLTNLQTAVNNVLSASVNYATDTFREIFELICQLASEGGVLRSIVGEVEGDLTTYRVC